MDYASGLSDALKKRVENASPSGSRCLIENCPSDRAVQFCHVATKSMLEENKMNALEWCWNMRKNTLNLDSRYNIMCVGASLYRLYEQHCWSLLPDTDIIDQYYNSLEPLFSTLRAERTAFPHIPNGIFSYRLLPLCNMKSFGIIRQQDTGPPTVGSFDHHVYPFDQVPLLQSHVHPRFAILDLGRKLHAVHEIMAAYEGSQLKGTLIKVFRLYAEWTHCVYPLPEEETASYKCGRDDDDDSSDGCIPKQALEDASDTSKRTQYHRTPNYKRPQSWSATRGLTKRSHPSSSWLSSRSLAEYRKQVGAGGWTTESISKWRQNLVCHET